MFINNLVYTKNINVTFIILGLFIIIELLSLIFGPMIEYISLKIKKLSILRIEKLILNKTASVKYEMLENSEFYSDLERFTEDGASKPYDLYETFISIITSFLLLINSTIYIYIINKYYALIIIILTLFSIYFLNKVSDEQFKIKW